MASQGKTTVLVQIHLEGLQQALKGLKKYKGDDRVKLLKKAVRAAGNELLKVARKFVPVDTGWLKKSLSQKIWYNKKKDILAAIVGVKSWATAVVFPDKSFQKWNLKKDGRNFPAKSRFVIAHKYAHFAYGDRKSFLQTYTYTNRKGSKVQIRRQIGASKGTKFLDKAVQNAQSKAIAKAADVVAKGL